MSPSRLYIEVNRKCNLRCESCDFWKDDKDLQMTDDRLSWLIQEFADIGGKTVITCGGEPTLSGERFWLLHSLARDNGLKSFSVHNGSGVNRRNVGRWAWEGPTESSVSLDSHDREKHNRSAAYGQESNWRQPKAGVGSRPQAPNGST